MLFLLTFTFCLPPMNDHIIKLASKDIKCITHYNTHLAFGSRDMNIYLHNLLTTKTTCIKPESVEINSLVLTHNILIAGFQDGSIRIYEFNSLNEKPNKPIFLLQHSGNVCSLSLYNNMLLTASWDNTFKLWDLASQTVLITFNLPSCVWAAVFIDEFKIVSACGDKVVRLFGIDGSELEKFEYHVSPVRAVRCFDDFVVSIGNDGKVILAKLDGRIVKVFDCKNFLYGMDIKVDDNGEAENDNCGERSGKVIVVGENGLVVLFDLNLNLIGMLNLKVQTCWCVCFNEDKLYIGGSDGHCFIVNTSEFSNEEEVKLNSNFIPRTEDKETKCKDPNYKIENGKAYVKEGESWVLVGDVIDQGEQFDQTFNADVEGQNLQLKFNNDEDAYDVAERFLKTYNLRREYTDEIVEFINKNAQKKPNFYIYKDINIDGVSKYLNDSELINSIRNVNKDDNKMVEQKLVRLLNNKPNFYVVDCYRFFVAHGFSFDFIWLQDYLIEDRKAGTVYLRLLCNLMGDMPFNFKVLKRKWREVIDRNWADEGTVRNFLNNVSEAGL